MKRIVLIATAVAGIFTAGIATVASAATTPTTPKYVTVKETKLKPETTTVHARAKCNLALTIVAPAGSASVTPGTADGSQYGTQRCGALGAGITQTSFTTDDSGEITGTVGHWFRRGSISGTYSLTQAASDQPPTTSSFTSASYTGTVKLTAGNGTLKGATGTGTLKCTTPDGVHFACTESVRLTQTVTVLKKVTVEVRVKVAS